MAFLFNAWAGRLRGCAAAAIVAALPALAGAADLTVVLDDQGPAYADFVAQLRIANAAANRVTQGRVETIPLARWDANDGGTPPQSSDDSVIASVRTRSLPPRVAEPSRDAGVLVAVGLRAARAVMGRKGSEPVLLALLGRLDYELLRASGALRRAERPLGVLLRDPSPGSQLSLIDAILPGRRRVGVVADPQAAPLLQELDAAARRWPQRRAASPGPAWTLNTATVEGADGLDATLREVLPASDALLVLPEPLGATPAAGVTLLRAAARANLPVFASSDAMVQAGALAALVPSSAQLAQQAQELSQRLQQAAVGTPIVEAPRRFDVRTNPHVAQQLGLALAPDAELTARLAPRD